MKQKTIKTFILAATMTQIFSCTVWGETFNYDEKYVEANISLASPSDATDIENNLSLPNVINQKDILAQKDSTSASTDFKYEINDNSIKIIKYIGNSTDVEIPAQIDNIPVKIIGEKAFLLNRQIKSVYIPEGIEIIEGGNYSGAFNSCSNLTNVNLPNTLVSIGDYAFSGSKINTIQLPQNLEYLGSYAFMSCPLSNIIIPSGISSISGGVFEYCSLLEEVILPDTITSIGSMAFAGCESLSSIDLPKNVNEIGIGAFQGSGLKSLTIPNKVTKIEPWVFLNCHSLTNITIPNSISIIDEEAFAHCTALENITIPDSVTTLVSDSIYGVDNLNPESGGGEGYQFGPFYRCDNLKVINGGNGLTSVGKTSFYLDKSNVKLTILNTSNNLLKNYDWNNDNRYLEGATPPSNKPGDKDSTNNNGSGKDESSSNGSNTSGGNHSSGGSSSSSSSGTPKTKSSTLYNNTMTGIWFKDSNGWWFSKSTGDYAKDEWGQINNKWYYFDTNGYMQKGWKLIQNSWYYLNPKSDSEGSMQTGWIFDTANNKWYFCSDSGSMRTGWIYDSNANKWYYCDKDGAMLTNTWIDSYYVNSDGSWLKNE